MTLTQLLLRHATRREFLDAILASGLEPRKTTEHNYKGRTLLATQPVGVYALPEGYAYGDWNLPDLPSSKHVVLRFAYCGPALVDEEIRGAFVVPDVVPADVLEVTAHKDRW